MSLWLCSIGSKIRCSTTPARIWYLFNTQKYDSVFESTKKIRFQNLTAKGQSKMCCSTANSPLILLALAGLLLGFELLQGYGFSVWKSFIKVGCFSKLHYGAIKDLTYSKLITSNQHQLPLRVTCKLLQLFCLFS